MTAERPKVLRVAHPIYNVPQIFGKSDACVRRKCGLDVEWLEYIASSLGMEIRCTRGIKLST